MIPDELRALDQWVAWRTETRNGKRTKVPINVHTGKRASSTDPDTWASHREALAHMGGDGVGFVFSPDDPYTGIDMDGCVSANGAIQPDAYKVVRSLDGYTEFSPSGRGLHIIVRGSIPRGRHTLRTEWHNEIAVYSSGRFFTMSGDGRGTIREAQDELTALIAYYFPEPDEVPRNTPQTHPKPLYGTDSAVVDRIHADPRMAALWAGDTSGHEGDHSAADLALCAHLAFLTGSDAARMDSLFRSSGLWRSKWDEPRGEGTYGSITIQRALGRA